MRSIARIRLCVALVAAFVTGACATTQGRVAPSTSAACAVVPVPSSTVDSALIVVTSPVDVRNIGHPTTWGEQFVSDLGNGLAHFDCSGHPLPNIAGPYAVSDLGSSTLRLDPSPDGRGPRLTIRSVTDADARDLIDAGVDLLMTESSTLAAYAATRPSMVSVQLPWDRSWVVLTTRQVIPGSDTTFHSSPSDVVRTDARPARGPYWWSIADACVSTSARSVPGSRRTSRILYSRDEPVARALAERLVALAGGATTAVGLAPNMFGEVLATGADLAYVLPLPSKTLDRCKAVGDLLARAPWLAGSSTAGMTALIDTRLTAVVKRDRLHLEFTRDSSIVVTAGPK